MNGLKAIFAHNRYTLLLIDYLSLVSLAPTDIDPASDGNARHAVIKVGIEPPQVSNQDFIAIAGRGCMSGELEPFAMTGIRDIVHLLNSKRP
jgi:hypothetical protein